LPSRQSPTRWTNVPPVGSKKWYAYAKVIWEFVEKNRAAGWNFCLTLAMPLRS